MNNIRLFGLLALSLLLSACINSDGLNQKSEKNYRRIVDQMEMFGVVDKQSALDRRVQRIFSSLHPIAEKYHGKGATFAWEIALFRSPDVSAWTMPGGKMIIHSGLIEKLRLSDDELSVILAHEMAHVVKEHGKNQVNLSRISGAVGLFGSAAVSSAVNYAGSALALAPEYMINKPFSRSNELEADAVGILIMAQAGYNPNSVKPLWEKLYEFSGDNDGSLKQLLSTHPNYAEREANIEKILPQAQVLYQQSRQ
ncbi:M48 family metallopeptidase [Pasteurella testudinis]|uniref:M48 family metallopeptidase n=1 Tax=Pasteurella testudinis TaxID=761 RepID=UPI00405A3527